MSGVCWQDHYLAPLAIRRMAAWNLAAPILLATSVMGMVLRVDRPDGGRAVLKCLSESGRRFEGAAASVLAAFDGRGAVRLLGSADDAVLIEHCMGGRLSDAPNGSADAVAVPVIIDVLRSLHAVRADPPARIPSLAQRCAALGRGLDQSADPEARALLMHARNISAHLLATSGETRLLHGDIHHGNIMQAARAGGDAWVSIDPQAVTGERAYEVANVFGNPSDRREIVLEPGRPGRLADRFAGELGLDRDRALGWAFAHSCIAAAWDMEDGHDPAPRLETATAIAAFL